jgi:inosine/xanthosine triphosphatase
MKIIVVSSQNPVKIQATLSAFQKIYPDEVFEVKTVSVSSGVSDQPSSSEETYSGAQNRVNSARQVEPEADYWVGIEGGVEEINGEMAAFAWILILTNNQLGRSRTGTFFLPTPVVRLIKQGYEMGTADDIVFSKSNSKQDIGAVGLLSNNVLNRVLLYEQAIVLALLPILNHSLYSA